MNLINTYLYLNYSAIIAFFVCLLYGLLKKVYRDKVLFLSLIFILVCFLTEFLSYVLAKNHIRTHFLNYFLSLDYIIVLYLIFRVSNPKSGSKKFILICFCSCITGLFIEIIWLSGWERTGGISALISFFWTIFIIIYLIKQLFILKETDFNGAYFWVYISILISKLFTIGEKGFGDLMIESNMINTFLVVAIISYSGVIISNIFFLYSFFLYSKKPIN
jgi:hypothetical protein